MTIETIEEVLHRLEILELRTNNLQKRFKELQLYAELLSSTLNAVCVAQSRQPKK